MTSDTPPSLPPPSAPGVVLEGHRLDEIAREVPGATLIGDGSVRVFSVFHDSRRIELASLFVARKGSSLDGTKVIAGAVARGALAVMAQRGTVDAESCGVPVLLVDDIGTGLAYAAACVYGHPSFGLEVIGITGTNGKTTTAHLVRTMIDGAHGAPHCAFIGTVGHSFGSSFIEAGHTTPEADELARLMARFRTEGASHVAMETSSIALALGRVRAVRFRVAAFTNLTQDHLDFHGTMEAYAEAKAELFVGLGPGAAVVNIDDPYGAQLTHRVQCPLIRVSRRIDASDADLAPRTANLSPRGIEAIFRTPQGDVEVSTRLVGAHNLENLAVALGIAHALDLDLHQAAKSLQNASSAPGRLERCDGEGDDIIVVVDYAHTPDALEKVLESVRTIVASEGGRVTCVFGCGGDRDPKKRGPMGEAAGKGADRVVLTSDNPRTEDPSGIARQVEAGLLSTGKTRTAYVDLHDGMDDAMGEGEFVVELDRRKAIAFAIASARPGDTVVIAGKGHENYQIVGTQTLPFDDCEEARRALEGRRARAARSRST